jgi:hypothetical protein
LPDWRLPPVDAWAVFPGRRLMPTRTRVFLDALTEKFSGPECRTIEADVRKTKARLLGSDALHGKVTDSPAAAPSHSRAA